MPIHAPLPPTPKTRERRHPCRYKYVRKVKGSRYQARIYIGPSKGDSVNLGLYETERATWEAVRRTIAVLGCVTPVTAIDLWAAAMKQVPGGHVVATLLPKYVRRRGEEYVARVTKQGRRIEIGPFSDPEAAHRAMVWVLRLGFAPPGPCAKISEAKPRCDLGKSPL